MLRRYRWARKAEGIAWSVCQGLHSGYPLCCILAFVGDEIRGVDVVAQARWEEFGLDFAHAGGGYVPCRRHMRRVVQGRMPMPSECGCDCSVRQGRVCRLLCGWMNRQASARDCRNALRDWPIYGSVWE